MIKFDVNTKPVAREVPVRVLENKYGRSIQRPTFAADPYRERPRLHTWGPSNQTPLAVYTSCPDDESIEQRRPFQGEEGSRVRGLFSAAGMFMDDVWQGFLVDRKLRSADSHEDALCIEAQRDAFWAELKQLKAFGVTTILGMGKPVLEAMNIKSSLDAQRGSVNLISLQERGPVDPGQPYDFVFVPTFHPSQLVQGKQFYEKQDMKVNLVSIAVEDFKKAKDLADNGYQPLVEKFILEPTIDDVLVWDRMLKEDDLLAVDIETTALQPHEGNIVVIGFAKNAEEAISIPILDKGGRKYWSDENWEIVCSVVDRWLSKYNLMFQNGYFDVYWLREKNFQVPRFAIKHDTLVLHHSINPEQDHDIGFISSMYAKTTYWKGVFKERDVPILQMDQIEMRRYNLRDCTVLHQCLPGLWADLQEIGPRTVRMYEEEAIPMIEVCLELHRNGVPLSEVKRKEWAIKVQAEVDRLEQACRELGELDPMFSLNSDMDMRVFLFGEVGSKYKKADQLLQKKPGTKLYRELQALDYVRKLVPLWLPNGGFAGRKTDTGMTKVDDQGRLSLQVKAQNRLAALRDLKKPQEIHLEEAMKIERLLNFLAVYGEYSAAIKLQETYVKWDDRWPDGKIHSDWKSYGTATGRLASKKPNAQNWPKGGDGKFASGVRELFEAPAGWCFLSMDYANLEVGTMAYTSGEPNLITVFEKGVNLHDLNTKNLFGITEDHPNWKRCRKAAKTFQFGIQYGGGTREIYEKICMEVPDLGLTYSEYEKCVKRYFEANATYTEWRARVQDEVRRSREIVTPFGRVRRFYGITNDILKEALNFPCQSAAASIINLAALRIMRGVWQRRWKAQLVLQIHDQLVFLAPMDEVKELKELMQEEMSRPVDWNGQMKSFPVDPEAGFNFGQLVKWADFVKENF